MNIQEALCKKYGITERRIKERMENNKKQFEKYGILKKYWKGIAIQELLKELPETKNSRGED